MDLSFGRVDLGFDLRPGLEGGPCGFFGDALRDRSVREEVRAFRDQGIGIGSEPLAPEKALRGDQNAVRGRSRLEARGQIQLKRAGEKKVPGIGNDAGGNARRRVKAEEVAGELDTVRFGSRIADDGIGSGHVAVLEFQGVTLHGGTDGEAVFEVGLSVDSGEGEKLSSAPDVRE